jgi:hypothetical protein
MVCTVVNMNQEFLVVMDLVCWLVFTFDDVRCMFVGPMVLFCGRSLL